MACVFTGRPVEQPTRALVTVTARAPEDALYRELAADPEALARADIRSLVRIGDCDAPGTIAAAVYAGHRAARTLGAEATDEARRERPLV